MLHRFLEVLEKYINAFRSICRKGKTPIHTPSGKEWTMSQKANVGGDRMIIVLTLPNVNGLLREQMSG